MKCYIICEKNNNKSVKKCYKSEKKLLKQGYAGEGVSIDKGSIICKQNNGLSTLSSLIAR